MLFVIFIGLVCLALSAYFVGDAVTLPARERQSSVSRAARYGSFRPALGAAHKPFRERVLVPLGERLARWTLKLHPRTTIDGDSKAVARAPQGAPCAAAQRLIELDGARQQGMDERVESLREAALCRADA